MGILNPPSSAPTSSYQSEPAKPTPSYRNVQPLPARLLDNCTVCIEEELFSQAIPILSSALTAGHGTPRPSFVPPPQHLSLLATLIVHPSMTTRTTSEEKQTASDDAFRYLSTLSKTTSPKASGLTKALQYRDADSSRAKRARTRFSDISSDDDLGEGPGHIRSPYAKSGSLFANADDFWAVVGWAFNCSVVHKHRWTRWKIWLELMLDVLQDDLESTYQEYRDSSPRDEKILNTSLIAQHLAPYADQGRNSKRRIMRAILADGQKPSLNQFPEIWRNETLPPKSNKPPETGTKRPLDLDHGEYGDYFDSESDSETTTPADIFFPPRSKRTSTRAASGKHSPATPGTPSTPQPPSNNTGTSTHGPPSSLHQRLRLLTLLSRFTTLHPTFFLDFQDLLGLYTEFLRPLPLPVFTYFLLSGHVGTTALTASDNQTQAHKTSLDSQSLSPLLQTLLSALLSTSHAPPRRSYDLSWEIFAGHFAPYAAGGVSVGENARVGVCVEGLLRLLVLEGEDIGAACGNKGGEDLWEKVREAVEKGVRGREGKVGGAGRDREVWEAMVAGGERMRGLLEVIR